MTKITSRLACLALLAAALAAGPLWAAEPEPTVIPDGQPNPIPNPLTPDGLPPHIVMPMDREALQRWQEQVMARIQQQMAEARQRAGQPAVRQVRFEKAAFLGVSTAPLPPKLREELKIAPNQGVQVEFVEPGSPAATAGIKPKDILTKLDDQKLINAQQLAVLVREHKPGDTLNITGFRDGKPATFAPKLVEKEVPVLEDTSPWLTDQPGHDNKLVLPGAPGLLPPLPAVPGGVGQWNESRVTIRPGGEVTQTFNDGQTSLTLTTKDNAKTLVAKDRDGKELFNGPINTPEERAKLPADVAASLDKLERTTRIGIMPGGPAGGLPGPGGALIVPPIPVPPPPPAVAPAQPPHADAHVEVRSGQRAVSVASSDQQHSIQLSISGPEDARQTRATIKDRATGAILFQGPLNTPEDRAKVPADLLPKLEALEKKAGT